MAHSVFSQKIKAPGGFDDQVGSLYSMMEDLRSRITNSVSELNQEQTDFLLDDQANRIGALIMHLAATEKYYQVYTFEGRDFNAEEKKIWEVPLGLGEKGREEIKGKPIQYYLDIWEDVRQETKKLLKSVDDKWLQESVGDTNMNNYWAWYHVMEHQSNHMGQIRLVIKRM